MQQYIPSVLLSNMLLPVILVLSVIMETQQWLSAIFLSSYKICHTVSNTCKVPDIFVQFLVFGLYHQIIKSPISNLKKIRPLQAEYTIGQREGSGRHEEAKWRFSQV
jgi:hypothetical protein